MALCAHKMKYITHKIIELSKIKIDKMKIVFKMKENILHKTCTRIARNMHILRAKSAHKGNPLQHFFGQIFLSKSLINPVKMSDFKLK